MKQIKNICLLNYFALFYIYCLNLLSVLSQFVYIEMSYNSSIILLDNNQSPKLYSLASDIRNTSNQKYCQNIINQLLKIVLPDYNPKPLNQISEYNNYTSDSTYY